MRRSWGGRGGGVLELGGDLRSCWNGACRLECRTRAQRVDIRDPSSREPGGWLMSFLVVWAG